MMTTQIDRRTMMAHLAAILAAGPATRTSLAAAPIEASPPDARFGKLKDLKAYFPFEVPSSDDEWSKRAEELRKQILISTGLWPMLSRPSIEATIHGKVDRDTYTVEKVFFQSSPGLYVTGSLYRPTKTSSKRPAVLCPHGHWKDGRFFDHGELLVREEIKTGAEKFPIGGRYPLQARCVQLARLGCVVFHYDMLGYADSVPLSKDLAHGFKQQRPHMSRPDHWGLFSAQAELRLLNPMGLQTFNSIRALDFVTALPDVDPARVGVTGASGGGTQTFFLMAVDERPAAAFPAVMVSTAMQGGCTCENASYLRVGTGNIEIAALCAPRPLGMTAADDWTNELETKGLPELKRLYEMLGAGENVEGKYYPFPHNYNAVSRSMMYEFFNKHLKLGATSPIVETDFEPLSVEEMSVWNSSYPKPPMDEAAEIALLQALSQDVEKQIAALTPKDDASWKEWRRIIGGAWETMIGRKLLARDAVEFISGNEEPISGGTLRRGRLRLTAHEELVPALYFQPHKRVPQQMAVWIHPLGKESAFNSGSLNTMIPMLVRDGFGIIAIDLLGQGESRAEGHSASTSRAIENGREAACFSFGYNHPLFAQRVHDILSAIAFAQGQSATGRIALLGWEGTGPFAAAAACLAPGIVDKVICSTKGFRFQQVTDIQDPQLLPGAVKYGDVPALLGLCAPCPLALLDESSHVPELTKACYYAAGDENAVIALPAPTEDKFIAWITA